MANGIRLLNTRNVYEKKFKRFECFDGIWLDTLGAPERNGLWLIYGMEKHGKTWCSLMVSVLLSRFAKVVFISAEEGISANFQDTLDRIGVHESNKRLYYSDYLSIDELRAILKSRRAPGVVVIDNVTFYQDELKNGVVRKLQKEFPDTLFIFLAHEEKGEPYTATAKLIKKLAKVIMHVKGLSVTVWGRCPGGRFDIDNEKAALYYGQLN